MTNVTRAWMLRMARRWLDEPTVVRVVEPLLADWQHETSGLAGMARWHAHVVWATALATTGVVALGRQAVRPLPVGLSRTGLGTLAAGTFAGTAVMLGGYLLYGIARSGPAFLRAETFVLPYLLPSLLASAFLVAVLPASAAVASSTEAPGWQRRIAALRLVVLCTLLAAGGMEWGIPAANQRYRQVLASTYRLSEPPRGVREFSTSELFSTEAMASLDRDRVVAERHNRLAIVASPAVFALLGGVIGARLRRRGWLAGALWLASVGAMVFSQQLQRGYGGAGAWAPLTVWVLLSAVLCLVWPAREPDVSTSA